MIKKGLTIVELLVNTVGASQRVVTQKNSVNIILGSEVLGRVDIFQCHQLLCFRKRGQKVTTILVKGDQNQSIFHEFLVRNHGVDNVAEIPRGELDAGIVRIVLQVRSVEHVLRGTAAHGDVLGEVLLGVDDVLAASGVVADVVEGHERVMLAALRY